MWVLLLLLVLLILSRVQVDKPEQVACSVCVGVKGVCEMGGLGGGGGEEFVWCELRVLHECVIGSV